MSKILVAIQFFCLAILALTGPLLANSPSLLLLELAGIALAGWAILTQGIGNFNVTPDPVAEGKMVTAGPYRVIRHPMYASLLLAVVPVVLENPSFLRWSMLAVLVVDVQLKLTYEEKLLKALHAEYGEYCSRTWRLIPFVY
jgi:protein-S-isoprenylcysteine O-methyltransferase Ste14